ncbi:hypothetical protein BDC45DRAFT_496863 [Circinella umbellata]|nr:hypothetical protein BDC45DRAFT_496863 [Circinella umbellata]
MLHLYNYLIILSLSHLFFLSPNKNWTFYILYYSFNQMCHFHIHILYTYIYLIHFIDNVSS